MRPAWHRAGGAFSYASSIRPRKLYAFTETHTERLRFRNRKQPLTAIGQRELCTRLHADSRAFTQIHADRTAHTCADL